MMCTLTELVTQGHCDDKMISTVQWYLGGRLYMSDVTWQDGSCSSWYTCVADGRPWILLNWIVKQQISDRCCLSADRYKTSAVFLLN